MSAALDIRTLRESDVTEALRLSTQAGWNQREQDWRRLLALWPKSCLGAADGDHLIATATLACFGTVGWIGMILVDAGQRGRGIGGQMLERVVTLAASLGVNTIGLDATELGRPVYLKHGFVDQRGIDRWSGAGGGAAGGSARALRESDWPAVLAMDRRAAGVDRASLLHHLAQEPEATAHVADWNGRIVGVAFARPGRIAATVGPVVAENIKAATAVTAALLAVQPGPIFVDVPAGSLLAGTLMRQGFTITRRLMRMSRPHVTRSLLTGPEVFAGAGFELG